MAHLHRVSRVSHSMTPVEQLDYAVWPVLHRMTTRGLRGDRGALDAPQRKAGARMEEVLAELEREVGHPINPNSGVQVAAWMEDEGFVDRKSTRLNSSHGD